MFSQKISNHRRTRHWATSAVVAVLVVATGWQCIGAWTDSQTTDEAAHLVSGYSYWQTNDHRLNPEHPPLLKLLAAVPLLFVPDLQFSTDDPAWAQPDQWGLGFQFLYLSRLDPAAAQWILFLGRLVPIALTITLGWLLWWWAKKKWGYWAGLTAAGLFLFEPTVLGHGHLVTTDIPVALAFVATMVMLERFLERPSRGTMLWLAVIFALAQVTKFSAVLLWLLVPLIVLRSIGYGRPRLSWRWGWSLLLTLLVVTPLLVWATYGFEVRPLDADPAIRQAFDLAADRQSAGAHEPPLTTWLIKHAQPDTAFGRWLQSTRHWPVPAHSYWRGLIETSNHNYYGHTAFLLGQIRVHGWWYYFPAALGMKATIVTLAALVGAGLIGGWRWWRRRTTDSTLVWLMIVPPLVYLAWSLTSHINIGLRHILPFMVFIPLWIAAGVTQLPSRFQPIVAGGLVGLLLCTSLLAWPRTIGYFNGLVGGSQNGPNLLHDSNYDWNQDTWRLRSYLQRHPLPTYSVAITGNRRDLFFPNAGFVPDDGQIAAGLKPRGTYFINAMALFDRDNPFHWLWAHQPTEIIGTGIYRFDFH